MPKISVIVPVYKVEPYLHRCVDSILAQTFRDFELILVDDRSPDNCPAICDEYAMKDERVVVIHQENGGLSAARNAGIDWAFANSDSEWITFIDSDDWVHPEMLERLYHAVIEHNVSVSVCSYVETNDSSQIVKATNSQALLVTPEDFFTNHNTNFVVAWGKLYNKTLFCNLRYPVGKIHEDEFTTYKALFPLKQIVYISDQLYFYFFNPNGITHTMSEEKLFIQTEALSNQLCYFNEYNYIHAKEFIKPIVLSRIAQYHQNSNSYTSSTVSLREIKRNFSKISRKLVHHFPKELSFKKHIYLYEIAYPKTMHIYWIAHAILNKLRFWK